METKRLLLFIVSSVSVLLVWGYLFPPPKRVAPKKSVAAKQGKKGKAGKKILAKAGKPGVRNAASQPSSQAASAPSSQPTSHAASRPRMGFVQPAVKPMVKKFKTKLYTVGVNNVTGGLSEFTVHKFRDTSVKGNQRVAFNLLKNAGKKKAEPFVERFLDANLAKHKQVAYKKIEQISEKPMRWKLTAELPVRQGGVLLVEKIYTFEPGRYRFRVDFALTNRSSQTLQTKMLLAVRDFADPASLKGGGLFSSPPELFQVLCKVVKENSPKRLDFANLAKEKQIEGVPEFVGIDRRYFMVAIVPRWAKGDKAKNCEFHAEKQGRLEMEVKNAGQALLPGANSKFHYVAYIGPKYYGRLKQVAPQERFSSSIDFGIFAFLCRPMLWLMQLFYDGLGKIGFANWGIAIILLTLLVKGVMWPLTARSMKSMQRMQILKPEIDKIKAKYGDDKESVQRETMNLYVQKGINPMSGCWPMLLQMPIWIALYNTLFYSVELYQAPFIPGWISDLSAKDPFYILPVLLGISMFLQQKFTPTASMDETQAKIMAYMMPIMFTSFMFFLPAGLTLYIFVNTVLSILHHWHLHRNPPKEDDSDKKPKKGGWMQRMQQLMEEQQRAQNAGKR